MSKVKDILKAKGSAVFSVLPSVTVYSAIEQMCERNIGGLVIVEEGKLIGIFTERDYARKLILKGKSSKETQIRELMTPHPITVTTHSTIDECMNIMSGKRIRHLPVVEEDKLVGMISIGDVVKQIIADQESTIEQLKHYIGGT